MDKDFSEFDDISLSSHVLKYPKQKIYTFGDTNFSYKIISENENGGAKLRSGQLTCGRPVIITPDSFYESFEGFSSDAVEYSLSHFADIVEKLRILGYKFVNNVKLEEEYSESPTQVCSRILQTIPKSDKSTAVLISPQRLWNSALIKIMFEIIKRSFRGNLSDLQERGFFLTDIEKIRNEIEILFLEALNDKKTIDVLAQTLQEYEMFEEYEDRFFELFK